MFFALQSILIFEALFYKMLKLQNLALQTKHQSRLQLTVVSIKDLNGDFAMKLCIMWHEMCGIKWPYKYDLCENTPHKTFTKRQTLGSMGQANLWEMERSGRKCYLRVFQVSGRGQLPGWHLEAFPLLLPIAIKLTFSFALENLDYMVQTFELQRC